MFLSASKDAVEAARDAEQQMDEQMRRNEIYNTLNK